MKVLTHLAAVRFARRMSQATLAERAGLPQSYVSGLERGLIPTSPDHVVRLAAVLEVSPDDLSAAELRIGCNSLTGARSLTFAR